uniref:Uncharacterized protein n=1 Tax=Arundo donax TaxID=35708 RepID=A0A0A9NAC9_ARUDO
MTSRYAQEMETIDELLNERNAIHASYTNNPTLQRNSSSGKGKSPFKGSKSDDDQTVKKEKKSKSQPEEGSRSDDGGSKSKKEKKPKDWIRRKKWFNIHLKVDKRRPC